MNTNLKVIKVIPRQKQVDLIYQFSKKREHPAPERETRKIMNKK